MSFERLFSLHKHISSVLRQETSNLYYLLPDPANYLIKEEEADVNEEDIETPAVESQITHEDLDEGGSNQETSLTKSKNDLRCEECGKQCKTQKHFINHKYYHKYYLNGEQEFCEKCSKNIPKKLFNRHLQTVHTDEKVIKIKVILSFLHTYISGRVDLCQIFLVHQSS